MPDRLKAILSKLSALFDCCVAAAFCVLKKSDETPVNTLTFIVYLTFPNIFYDLPTVSVRKYHGIKPLLNKIVWEE